MNIKKTYLSSKKKSTAVVAANRAARIYLRNKKENIDPLTDKNPRSSYNKNSQWTMKGNERKEVKEQLYPYIEEFIKTRLKWKKMSKYFPNDPRSILTHYFIGSKYNSTILNASGHQVKKFKWSEPQLMGKEIMSTIKREIQGFSDEEIVNTLINIMYKYRVDHYSIIAIKSFVNNQPDKNEVISFWDKISERVQV